MDRRLPVFVDQQDRTTGSQAREGSFKSRHGFSSGV